MSRPQISEDLKFSIVAWCRSYFHSEEEQFQAFSDIYGFLLNEDDPTYWYSLGWYRVYTAAKETAN